MSTRTPAQSKPDGWFKSTFSNPSQECVEVRFGGDVVHVRDTKDNGAGPVITLTVHEWVRLISDLARSTRDVTLDGPVRLDATSDGGMRLRHVVTNTMLTYTAGEWVAFVAGVLVGEFDLPLTSPNPTPA